MFTTVPGEDFEPVFSGKHDNSTLGVADRDYPAAAIAGKDINACIEYSGISPDNISAFHRTPFRRLTMTDPIQLLNATAINAFIVIVVVIIHNEVLIRLSVLLAKMRRGHHFRLVTGVLGVLAAHTLQVWIFASVYYSMHHAEGWGRLSKNFDGSLLDCVYFSFTTFTTLGYGDIEAHGILRFLTGIESLTGLVLITWSASFLFIEMQRYWQTR